MLDVIKGSNSNRACYLFSQSNTLLIGFSWHKFVGCTKTVWNYHFDFFLQINRNFNNYCHHGSVTELQGLI